MDPVAGRSEPDEPTGAAAEVGESPRGVDSGHHEAVAVCETTQPATASRGATGGGSSAPAQQAGDSRERSANPRIRPPRAG